MTPRETDKRVVELLLGMLRDEYREADPVAIATDIVWYAAHQGWTPEDIFSLDNAREGLRNFAALRAMGGDFAEDAYKPSIQALRTKTGKRWASIRAQVIRELVGT